MKRRFLAGLLSLIVAANGFTPAFAGELEAAYYESETEIVAEDNPSDTEITENSEIAEEPLTEENAEPATDIDGDIIGGETSASSEISDYTEEVDLPTIEGIIPEENGLVEEPVFPEEYVAEEDPAEFEDSLSGEFVSGPLFDDSLSELEPAVMPEQEAPDDAGADEIQEEWTDGEVDVAGTAMTGICGDNLTWSLERGVLKISGTGDMWDYEWNTIPWYEKREEIVKVSIESGVTNIGAYAFYQCYNIKSIDLAESISSIKEWAFYDCDNLEKVTVPEGVKEIGFYAFHDCSALSRIDLPSSLSIIGEWAFYNCDNLKNLELPVGLTEIKTYTFAECDNLESISFPEGLTNIEGYAFFNCRGLMSLELPESVTNIGQNVFESCGRLSRITFRGDAPAFGSDCFLYGRAVAIYDPEKSGWTEEVKQKYGATLLVWSEIGEEIPDISHLCGDNLVWNLENGILTISGTGEMWNFGWNTHPWNAVWEEITEVHIESGVTSVGSYAFSECYNLRIVEIPTGITRIGNGAFNNCYSLAEIKLPASLTSIEEWAFYNCDSLKSMEIPIGITEIKPYTFHECDGMESILLPEGLTDIEGWAFSYCRRLESIVLPESLTNIGSNAFENCNRLSKMTFQGDAPVLENDCFLNNRSVAVYDPGKSGWTEEAEQSYGATLLIWKAEGEEIPDIEEFCGNNLNWSLEEGVLTIYGTGDMWNFSGNNTPWYENREKITEVHIESGVTSVGSYAFIECNNLRIIEVPMGITRIGDFAFYNCCSLVDIELPASVTSVGEWAFYNCDGLQSMEIPVGVTEIRPYTFHECGGMENILLPEGLIDIEGWAFSNCGSLESIVLPETLTNIGSNAFENCERLSKISFYGAAPVFENDCFLNNRSVAVYDPEKSGWTEEAKQNYGATLLLWKAEGEEIPDIKHFCGNNLTWSMEEGVLTISGTGEMWNFSCGNTPWNENREEIMEVHIESGVTSVGSYAFWDCNNLRTVEATEGIIKIGDCTFDNCDNLTDIVIPEGVTDIGASAFSYCCNLKSADLPSSLIFIGNNVFYNCYNLTDIELPASLTSIGEWAFYNCDGLKSMEIPVGVTEIRSYTFHECDRLDSIVLPAGLTGVEGWAFSNCRSLESIELPENLTSIGFNAFENCNKLSKVNFRGNAPVFNNDCFLNNRAVAVYNPDKSGWTEEVKQNYGATLLIWKTTGDEIPDIKNFCGNNLTWSMEEGVLTISGTGEMWNFSGSDAPWYESREEIAEVHIESGATSVGSYAFWDYDNLRIVKVTASITKVGDCAFENCDNLTDIVIPEGVTDIGASAFSYCWNLKSADLPSSLKSIGNNAFYNCHSLTNIELPAGLTSIGEWAFYNCDSLNSMEISGGVTEIKPYTFHECDGMESILLPAGLTNIGERAFSYCRGLTDIELPESIAGIGTNAFEYCDRLSKMTFSGNAPVFENDCFLNNRSVAVFDPEKSGWTEEVKQKYGATLLIWKAEGEEIPDIKYFCGDDLRWNLEEGVLTISGTGEMWNFYGGNTPWNENREEIKEVHIESGATSIGSYAFWDCNNLHTVEVTEGITRIGDCAFDNCDNLTDIIIPEGVTDIGASAFSNCCNLKSVDLPSGLSSIGNNAFYDCRNLTEIELPASLTSLGEWTFYNCDRLKSMEIPVGVTKIMPYTFYECNGMESILLPAGLTNIEERAFSSCRGLTEIGLPESIADIGINAFEYCDRLSKITFSGNAPVFNNDCFLNNRSVAVYDSEKSGWTEEVKQKYGAMLLIWKADGEEIPDIKHFCGDNLTWSLEEGVLTISGTGDMLNFSGGNAPWYDKQEEIMEMHIGSGATSVGSYAFSDCANLRIAEVPEGITKIGDSAFNCCQSLTDIVIPEGVTEIGTNAFSNCYNLKTIVMPSSLTSVGEWAFYNCDRLKSMEIPAKVTKIRSYTFWGCDRLESILLPVGLVGIEDCAFESCGRLESIELPGSLTNIGSSAFSYCTRLSKITFQGGAPIFEDNCFWNNRSVVVYDPEKSGWTEDVKQNYGAKLLLWKAEGEKLPDIEDFCGSNLTWSLEEGVLTISGAGDMWNFNEYNAPWHEKRNSITEVHIDPRVTSIGSYAFSYCNNLRIVEVPAGITGIGEHAFYYCTNLMDIELPESLTTIGSNAFESCLRLSKITFHGNAPVFENDCFLYIRSVVVYDPEKFGWTEVVKKNYGATLLSWKEEGEEIPDIKYFCGDNLTWSLDEGVLTISGTGDMCNFNIYASDTPWLQNRDEITEVHIESGVTSIGSYAFSNCRNLTNIELPESLTSIGACVFNQCVSLQSIVLPTGLSIIGNGAFAFCGRLTTVELPESLTSIGARAFGNCSQLSGVSFLGNAPEFGNDCFLNNWSMVVYDPEKSGWTEEVKQNYGAEHLIWKTADGEIPDINRFCGDNLIWSLNEGTLSISGTGEMWDFSMYYWEHISPWYKNQGEITEIRIESGVKTIGTSAFSNCDSLKNVEIPADISVIGSNAFGYCDNLSRILFSGDAPAFSSDCFNGINAIAEYNPEKTGWTEDVIQEEYGAFRLLWKAKGEQDPDASHYCGTSQTWNLASGVLTISGKGEMWNYNKRSALAPWYNKRLEIKEVHVDSGVTSLGECAFYGCENLVNVKLPNSLIYVKNNAFLDCTSLKKIVFPVGITEIGSGVFGECESLSLVIFEGDAPSIHEHCFGTVTRSEWAAEESSRSNIGCIAVYNPDKAGWTDRVGNSFGAKNLRWMTLAEYNRGIWFEKANLFDFVRIFDDGSTTVRLNKEVLDMSGLDYTIKIGLGYYQDGEWTAHEELNDAVHVLEDSIIELDGTILSKHEEIWENMGRLQLAALVDVQQEDTRIEVIDVEMRESSYELIRAECNIDSFVWKGIKDIKSTEQVWVSKYPKTVGRFHVINNKYPDGAEISSELKDILVEAKEYYEEEEGATDPTVRCAQYSDREAYWKIYTGNRSGLVEVKFLFEDEHDKQQYTHTAYLNVIADEYTAEVKCNPANKTLLPGETAVLEATAEYYHYINDRSKNNIEQRPVKNVTWEWGIDSGEEYLTSFEAEGNKLHLTAADVQRGQICVTAKIHAPRGNDESYVAAEAKSIINIVGDSYELSVPDFSGGLSVGSSMKVAPTLVRYYVENGLLNCEDVPEGSYSIAFDPTKCVIKDEKGNTLEYKDSNEASVNGDNPHAITGDIPIGTSCTIERISNLESPLTITAYVTDTGGNHIYAAKKDYCLVSTNKIFEFTGMNLDDHIRLFNDGSTTVRFEAPGYDVDFRLGYVENGVMKTHYELHDAMDFLSGNLISLDGTVLSKHTDVWNYVEWVWLMADVKREGSIVYTAAVGIETMNAGLNIWTEIPGPGSTISLAYGTSCSIYFDQEWELYCTEFPDADVAHGGLIKDINIETIQYYEDGEDVPIKLSFEHQEDGWGPECGTWTITAGYRAGLVKVNVDFDCDDLPIVNDYYFYINVFPEEYDIKVNSSLNDKKAVVGEAVTLEAVTTCTKHLWDEKNQWTEEGTLEDITWRWELKNTKDMQYFSSIETEGNKAVFHIGKTKESYDIPMYVIAYKNLEGQKPQEVKRVQTKITICDGYELMVDGVNPKMKEGESATLLPVLYYTTWENGKRKSEMVSTASISAQIDIESDFVLTVDGKELPMYRNERWGYFGTGEFSNGTEFLLRRGLDNYRGIVTFVAKVAGADGECVREVKKTLNFYCIGNVKARNITLNASREKAQTVDISYIVCSGWGLQFSSNNSAVTANANNGKVTVAKNFAGTAKITITVPGTNDQTPATSTFTVTVNKIPGKIAANNFTKNGSTKEQSFFIGAKRLGSGKLSYTSNVSRVKVSSSGKVTIPANYTGKATITITAAESGIYKAASKKITVTVNQIAGKVTAQNFTKNASAQAQSFSIGAKRLGGGKLTYACNTSKVKISTAGKVTIPANYSGIATITIKVSASGIYKAASTKITLTVKPQKPALSSLVNSAAGKMTVTWKKIASATGYQLQYATNSGFTANLKKVTITDASMVSKVIGSLKKGNTYYVRIRTYKTADGKTLYSGWSTVKTLKIVK